MSDGDETTPTEPVGPVEIYPMLRWTIPLHALLPVLIALAVSVSERQAEGVISWLWVILHVAFPIFLVATYPWWRGRGDEVALVVIINHAVTFVVGVALISWW